MSKSCCAPAGPSASLLLFWASVIGVCCGLWGHPIAIGVATVVSDLFVNFLKLVSLPIIFLSIVSTVSGMTGIDEIKSLGRRVVTYTLLTTILSASIGLALFIGINPVQSTIDAIPEMAASSDKGYLAYLLQAVPSNFIQPFLENQVIGVLFLAIVLSLSILSLPEDNRKTLHTFFSSLYAAVMKMTQVLLRLIPIAIGAFITLFIRDLNEGLEVKSLALYLGCVVAANLIQAAIVLPIFLKSRGIKPIKLFKAVLPALSVAFFTKSSAAALPMAMRCAKERAGISEKVAGFSLPLCTTINMNGCAAFILITVLFVSMSNGMTFTYPEMLVWIFMSTIAAVGNAGVPMGCYFLASAFLASMNVPLNIMGMILPFYALLDMLESAINVWSDVCVTASVQEDINREQKGVVGDSVAIQRDAALQSQV